MKRTLVLVLLLTLTSPAFADTLLDGTNNELAGVVVDGARQPLAGIEVRIVGESFVIELHSDTSGAFRLIGLPPGRYRVEPARGYVREPDLVPVRPQGIRFDRNDVRCCFCAMMRQRTFIDRAPVAPATPVDTHSTAQGMTIVKPGW